MRFFFEESTHTHTCLGEIRGTAPKNERHGGVGEIKEVVLVLRRGKGVVLESVFLPFFLRVAYQSSGTHLLSYSLTVTNSVIYAPLQ